MRYNTLILLPKSRIQRLLRIEREEEGIELVSNVAAAVEHAAASPIPTDSREVADSNGQTLSTVDLREIPHTLHQRVKPNEIRDVPLPPA